MTTAPTTDERPICPGCKNPIDPEVCWCGDYMKNHGAGTEHPAVPMGCDCLRDTSTTDERDDWDAFVAPVNPFKNARICSASEAATYSSYGTVRDFENGVSSVPTIQRGDPDFVMSRSELFEFANNPRRWKGGYRDGETEEKDWGTLLDICLLDTDNIKARIAVEPENYVNEKGETKPWNNNAGVCKGWSAVQGDAGKLIVKPKVMRQAIAAGEEMAKDEEIVALIRSAKCQVMFLATYHDAETDIEVPLKGLIDIVPSGENAHCLADLKTCRSAHPRAWESHVISYGLHLQGAIYLDGYNAATGETRNTFYHVLQESFAPYYSELAMLSAEFVSLGRSKYKEALKQYCCCLKTGKWPGYESKKLRGCRITEPPAWALLQ